MIMLSFNYRRGEAELDAQQLTPLMKKREDAPKVEEHEKKVKESLIIIAFFVK